MAQVNDLSRSLTAFDPNSTLVVVVEMSQASRMPEIGTSGCVSSERWCVQQEAGLPGQESGAP